MPSKVHAPLEEAMMETPPKNYPAGNLREKRFVLTQKISVLAGVIGVIGTRQHYGERGVGFTPASSKGLMLAGNLSHPPAQMVQFVLAGDLCRPPAVNAQCWRVT
jgi:hypothetical protein